MGISSNAQKSSKASTGDCESKNKSAMACRLTTPQFRKRKETVIASLKKQVLEKKELKNGFAYKFTGSDKMIDDLAEFIKTESACCDFFTFNLSISSNKKEAWLQITGEKGAKEFIKTELEM